MLFNLVKEKATRMTKWKGKKKTGKPKNDNDIKSKVEYEFLRL